MLDQETEMEMELMEMEMEMGMEGRWRWRWRGGKMDPRFAWERRTQSTETATKHEHAKDAVGQGDSYRNAVRNAIFVHAKTSKVKDTRMNGRRIESTNSRNVRGDA